MYTNLYRCWSGLPGLTRLKASGIRVVQHPTLTFLNEHKLSPSLQPNDQVVNVCFQAWRASTIRSNADQLPEVVREEHPVGDFQETVMLSIKDVCWHGIIWAAWVLTMTKSAKLFSNDETGAIAPLEARACQLASAPFQLTIRQEVVNARRFPLFILCKLYRRSPNVNQFTYLARYARVRTDGCSQCMEKSSNIHDYHRTWKDNLKQTELKRQ